jgi:hypothetical protein
MTVIGIMVAEYTDREKLDGDLGGYVENVLKKMNYHHLRIWEWENAHLKTNASLHEDPHTALNDAARTVICAANLALGNRGKRQKTKSTMQEVALKIEKHSQDTFE